MAEIKCPNCGTVISLEASDIESVVTQVRDEEFHRELDERAALMKTERDQAVVIAQQQTRAELQEELNAREKEIAQLKAQVQAQDAQAKAQLDAQAAQQQAAFSGKLAEQQAQFASQLAEQQAQASKEQTSLAAQVSQLKAQLAAQSDAHETQQQLAVAQAVAAAEKERDDLAAKVALVETEKVALEASMNEQLLAQARSKDEVIAYQQGEIERLKDMKTRLTTKMVGETLEQHCLTEFNRLRAAAFPNAYFEKDNEVVEGTKGDFIFRECDEDGTEIVSIMFEMKNEEDTTSTKKTNESFLDKLDKDRRKKGCEYAVLVSLLEPESELYNSGIVDMSYRYPKMYVVRPQFFIPIITLLRNAALSGVQYKREAALMRQQNIDITTFESDLETFKTGFFRNFEKASERFDDAIEGIDKTIKLLEKIRDNLTKSEKHLTAANNKLDDLSVKKLTRHNPTMRDMFAALEQGDPEGADEDADYTDAELIDVLDSDED